MAAAVGRVSEGYAAGDHDGARRQILSAYLDEFEPFEGRLRVRDAALVAEIEGLFRELTVAVSSFHPTATTFRLPAVCAAG